MVIIPSDKAYEAKDGDSVKEDMEESIEMN